MPQNEEQEEERQLPVEEQELVPTNNELIFKVPDPSGDHHNPRYFTRALDNTRWYREYRVLFDGEQYRHWNPHRSKWGIHIMRKELRFLLKQDSSMLYLGAATGTSLSHLCEVLVKGDIYAVEVAPTSFRKLQELAGQRPRLLPLLFDAARPRSYQDLVPPVDLVYMDVSQADQVEIFIRNLELFMKDGGTGIMVLKLRSISVAGTVCELREAAEKELEKAGLAISHSYDLSPYDKEHHCFVVSRTVVAEP